MIRVCTAGMVVGIAYEKSAPFQEVSKGRNAWLFEVFEGKLQNFILAC